MFDDNESIPHEDSLNPEGTEGGELENHAGDADDQAPGIKQLSSIDGMSWYIVNTYSGSEESVRINLLDRIDRMGMAASFGEILVPKTSVERVLKSGKKKLVDKTSFPGYVIIQMVMSDEAMSCVTTTPKVTGFVGNRKSPKAMSEQDIFRILNPDAVVSKPQTTEVEFSKGESVKVIDGPFTNFDGVVDEVRAEKMKVKVLVSIFGRETPVELAYNQVDKLS